MNKKDLSERDILTKFIIPALTRAGWDKMDQLREEVAFTKGRVMVHGKIVAQGKSKRADIVLSYKPNLPIALIEAKENNKSPGSGMQQALDYAGTLDIPFVFSSNGNAFVFHDRTSTDPKRLETTLALDEFPSPYTLWEKYRTWKGLSPEQEELVLADYYNGGDLKKQPRYYQVNAINAATLAIAKGQKRILLVMATGTGKTYTAFQIIWRFWKSGANKRILFLADRNVLVDQTMVNDFRPFGGAMAKLSTDTKTIERPDGTRVEIQYAINKRRINTAFEIYLGLYQALTGPEYKDQHFREFSPTFFDLIVIDECHRGSAADDAAWRDILDYFSSAIHIGLTATPKETKYISNINYFGEPIYTYSLKQGIQDGFLAPYKVINVHIDRDIDGYRPEKGAADREGNPIEDRIYSQKDFERTLVIDERTKLIAAKITEFLKESGDRFQKTIIFCVDEEHADRMRQALVNENADLCRENHRYVMRITGSDTDGQKELGNFIDPESKYPVLVTTSRLLSTGVDIQTCRLIVLERAVGSMTEFKQIVGRGTRIHEDTKKYYFTLIDFRNATDHFADAEFDGEPVQIYEPGEKDPISPPDEHIPPGEEDNPDIGSTIEQDGTQIHILVNPWQKLKNQEKRRKIYVDGVSAEIVSEHVEYLDEQGKLITENLAGFIKKIVKKRITSFEEFSARWNNTWPKSELLAELSAEGLPMDKLSEALGKDFEAFDPYDIIAHIAFEQSPKTRRERAEAARANGAAAHTNPGAQRVLEELLHTYEKEDVVYLNNPELLQIAPFSKMGTVVELIACFGSKQNFDQSVRTLQNALYKETLYATPAHT